MLSIQMTTGDRWLSHLLLTRKNWLHLVCIWRFQQICEPTSDYCHHFNNTRESHEFSCNVKSIKNDYYGTLLDDKRVNSTSACGLPHPPPIFLRFLEFWWEQSFWSEARRVVPYKHAILIRIRICCQKHPQNTSDFIAVVLISICLITLCTTL